MAIRQNLTDLEKKYIREHALTMTCAAIAREINRRGCDVSRYIKRENIPHIDYTNNYGGKERCFNKVDDLQKKIEETKSLNAEEAAKIIGIGSSSVYKYRHLYGIESDALKRVSDKDRQYVVDNYKHKTIKEIAKEIGFGTTVVNEITSRYGLRKNIKYTEDELQYIRDNYKKLRYKEIAKHLGRTEVSVKKHVITLGLKKIRKNR